MFLSIKRRIFEFGIVSMVSACIMILGLFAISLISLFVYEVITYNPEGFFKNLESLTRRESYIEILFVYITILIWGLFFIGLFLVSFSIILKLIFNLFFRSNLLKELPKEIITNPDDIVIVIPAYNEENTIKQVILDCKKYANHIVVIDDGSSESLEACSFKSVLIQESFLLILWMLSRREKRVTRNWKQPSSIGRSLALHAQTLWLSELEIKFMELDRVREAGSMRPKMPSDFPREDMALKGVFWLRMLLCHSRMLLNWQRRMGLLL